MPEPVVARAKSKAPWGPREWVLFGAVLLVLGVLLGVAANDDEGAAWTLFALVAVPGALMIGVGVIAKAVQVGIRSARD